MTNFSPGAPEGPASADPALLSIRQVSARTGIPVAGLRNWERRYGLPRPERSPGGQRRYRESDCAVLTEVIRGRERGLSLPAAIARATATTPPEASVFAGLRRRHADLRTHVMPKTILLALTRAIEDECCARAQRPILVGCFQRERFYTASRQRWADLARSADHTLVFADFPDTRRRPGRLTEIPIPGTSPMLREWALVCDAPDHPACVAGWEHPGQEHAPDPDRIFEVMWSVDPPVVRSASRIAAAMAAAAGSGLPAQSQGRLTEQPAPSSPDLRRASDLLERTLDYLTRTRPRPGLWARPR
jgi:MerR family transcriptional regulator, light-induced transcriptional regulator